MKEHSRLRNYRLALDTRPMDCLVPLGLTLWGTHALTRGDHVSRAFANFGGGFTVRFLGVLLIIGGILFAVGLYTDDAMYEILGLGCTLAGCFTYTFGVYFGLGEQGSMAGGAYLLIALGCIGRIRVIIRSGNRQARP